MSKPTVAENLADLISTAFVSLEWTEQGNPYVEIDGDKIADRIADEIRAAEAAAREPLEAILNQAVVCWEKDRLLIRIQRTENPLMPFEILPERYVSSEEAHRMDLADAAALEEKEERSKS